jgi:SNF2 family DNA or RNA helicase
MLYKTQPLKHQKAEVEAHAKDPGRALFWEQGTGKTKAMIDNAVALFEDGEIDGVFVVAPNMIHHNWAWNQIPEHMPDEIPYQCVSYSGERHASISHTRKMEFFLQCPKNTLAILAMSYDSLMTEHGRDVAKKFLTTRKCLFVADETRRISNVSAKRTKRVIAAGQYAKFRRALNGTPISSGPFDIYSQIQFCDPDFWAKNGIGSYFGFRTMFGKFKPIRVAGGKIVQVIDGYKNLELLSQMIAPISSRVTKDQVLDLPEKVFEVVQFELSPEQKRLYRELEQNACAVMDGEFVSTPMALVMILRLHQVTSGFFCPDATVEQPEPRTVDLRENPRLDVLTEICEDLEGKAIIWARFRKDIDNICRVLGDAAVRFDGSTCEDDRRKAVDQFQDPKSPVKFFVANPQAAGEGLTLTQATTVIYYTNDFKLAQRLQSEDRAHRIGQRNTVTYIDIVARGTIDERIIECLKDKLDVSSQVTKDKARSWFRMNPE